MNKILKSALLGIAIMFSVNFVSAQEQNSLVDWNYDRVYVEFINMGNLPNNGSVTITWVHPTYTNKETFSYVGTSSYGDTPAANNWISITVTVKLGHYRASKSYPGYAVFTFNGSDFTKITDEDEEDDNGPISFD